VLLPGRTGLLLDDASPSNIAAALRLLIEDPDLRQKLGEAAMEHASERFEPAANARAVEGVYAELLGIQPEPSPAPSRDSAAVRLERVDSR
jgi:glycosyltransferase involved in cell wall biosynthesis